MQKCSVTLWFPKLEALVPVHQGLSTLVILINDHDCVDIDKNGFVRYHNFFESILMISQNIDSAISDLKRTFPLKNETIFASRVRISDVDVQNIETKLAF